MSNNKTTISPAAQHALKAVKMRHTQGRYMARAYALKHGALSAYRLALQLEAVQYVPDNLPMMLKNQAL